MREIIENFEGTDAELLAELNTPSVKVLTPNLDGTPGQFGLKGVAKVSVELAASFKYTIEMAAASMAAAVDDKGEPDHTTRAQAALFSGFVQSFATAGEGLDFADDQLRGYLDQILKGAGWAAEQIEALLAFGYTLQSPAQLSINRDATQEDVDNERAAIARDAAFSAISQRANAAIDAAREAVGQGLDASAVTSAGVNAWEVV